MNPQPLRAILYTHDDLDGAGCHILYKLAHWHMEEGRDYVIVHCGNHDIDTKVLEMLNSPQLTTSKTEITFADISPIKKVMEQLVNRFTTVRVFEHHPTQDWIQQYPNCMMIYTNHLGIRQSATSIMYQYYCNIAFQRPSDPMCRYYSKDGNQVLLSRFVEAVRSYDTYDWKRQGTVQPRNLHMLFKLLHNDRFCDRYIDRILHDLQNNELIIKTDLEFVNARLEYEYGVIQEFTPDTVYTVWIRGYKTALVLFSKGASVSELGYQFLQRYNDYDLFICFSFARGGQFSIRTNRKDIDVGKVIAEPIGGGGHPQAAGCRLTEAGLAHMVEVLCKQLNRKKRVPRKEFVENPTKPEDVAA